MERHPLKKGSKKQHHYLSKASLIACENKCASTRIPHKHHTHLKSCTRAMNISPLPSTRLLNKKRPSFTERGAIKNDVVQRFQDRFMQKKCPCQNGATLHLDIHSNLWSFSGYCSFLDFCAYVKHGNNTKW